MVKATEFPPPSTALGDWYATLIFARPAHLVLCLSEKTRFCVLLPAREPKHLVRRFQQAAEAMLHESGVPQSVLALETAQMQSLLLGSTRGAAQARSLLGTLNERSQMVKWELQAREWRVDEAGLRELSHYLNRIPCGPLGLELPPEAALRLLQQKTPAHDSVPQSFRPFIVRPPSLLQ
ncbi:MAG: hypothetical protein JOZ57_06965 [Abitibacteriaceae bacterium]|nr:hypothetical protein [Abditibacteriaceae bacterium]